MNIVSSQKVAQKRKTAVFRVKIALHFFESQVRNDYIAVENS